MQSGPSVRRTATKPNEETCLGIRVDFPKIVSDQCSHVDYGIESSIDSQESHPGYDNNYL